MIPLLRSSVPVLLLVLAFAAMAGPVAAADDAFRVGSLVHDGPAVQEGELAMLFLLGMVPDAGAAPPARPWVVGSAGSVRAVEYTGAYREFDLPAPPVPPPVDPPVDTVQVPGNTYRSPDATFTLAQIKLAEYQDAFEVHAFGEDGFVSYSADSDQRSLEQRPKMQMSAQGFASDGLSPGGTDGGLESPNFAFVEREGPFVLNEGDARHSEVTLRGSFVLEMYGITLDLVAADGQATLASGEWRDPMADGSGAYDVRENFVRLFFEDAELTLGVDGTAARMEWVSSGLAMEPTGAVTLYHAYGRLGDAEFNDDRFLLPAGNRLAIAPTSDGLRVAVDEASLGPRGTIADVPVPASAALVGSGAVLALLVAVGIGLLRRVLRLPQLAEVERAIEAGEYRRAARMAGRIVARRPDDESAILARGIALSKAGQHQRTVAELSSHLAQSPASDGSLHYVLGLAQLDLGQRDAARLTLKEAVRLTPSLQADVGSRLGKAFSSPAPTPREASGYA